ncbi:GNAT family N-acetyltransferase [Pseudomonas putida]|uniref:GNAT family N-acetyltransferase n=1 Tax=Pseudomonas putida TaxID=303 RepID=A0ABD7BIB8_PSEPU|nr:GNAT family N-acetyltransferase [Pseudomonas putida]QOD00431.1 GNAT family N-acetyltransferase [Pseudomonas putida]
MCPISDPVTGEFVDPCCVFTPYDLALRPFCIRDHAQLERWAENIQSSGYMARFKPHTAALAWNVIVCNGQDVGAVWLERTEHSDEARLGILLGEPALLGRGIGRRAILLTIEAVTRVHPLLFITLNVRESNERGIRCYEHCGFHVTSMSERGEVGSTYKVITMKKRISRAI